MPFAVTSSRQRWIFPHRSSRNAQSYFAPKRFNLKGGCVIKSLKLREGVRSWLLYRAVLHFIAAGNLDEAHRLNFKNEDMGQRAICFVVGAQKLVDNKDTDRASEWLREAGALVRRSEANESLARIALTLCRKFLKSTPKALARS